MKVTKALVAAVATKYGMTPDQASAALNGEGVYRGAHNLGNKDFSTVRVDAVSGVVDGKLTFDPFTHNGTLPKGLTPMLMVSPADIQYTPVKGENVLVFIEDEDHDMGGAYVGAMVKEMQGRTKVVVTTQEGKAGPTEHTVTQNYVLLPVKQMTAAGPITESMYEHVFGEEDYDQAQIDAMAASLVEAGLTVNDLYDYTFAEDEDLDGTKFHKRMARRMKLAGHDILHFLATGDLVTVEKAEVEEKPAKSKAEPKVAAKAPAKTSAKVVNIKDAPKSKAKAAEPEEADEADPKAAFDAFVDEAKGAPLKALYAAVCKMAKIGDDDMETSGKLIKAQIKQLVNTDAKIEKLTKAGVYEAA